MYSSRTKIVILPQSFSIIPTLYGKQQKPAKFEVSISEQPTSLKNSSVVSVMDPWQNQGSVTSLDNGNDSGLDKSELAMGFEDHFEPFVKLPDSDEYLASLEKKLKTVERGSSTGGSLSSQEIVRSLAESHESCMVRLLTDSVQNLNGLEAEEELKVNPVMKKLAPEKQAITVEELVHLVKADQLAVLLESEQDIPANQNNSESRRTEEPKEDEKNEIEKNVG